MAEEGEPYPVINTEPSLLLRLDTALTDLSENFRKLTQSIQSLLSDQNLQSTKQLLQSSQKTMQLIETQTIPETNQAARDLSHLIENVSDMASDIQENPSILIRGKETPTLGPGE